MPEKRFLSFVLTEGVLLTLLSLLMLILPKISDITFGFMLCIALIIYGGYKAIASFLSRNFESHFFLNIVNSVMLFTAGVMMFFAPVVDMMVIITILGVYFIFQSLSSSAFALQVQNIFRFHKCAYVMAGMQLLFGILLIILLPTLWAGGILMGINFLISGVLLLNMYIAGQ